MSPDKTKVHMKQKAVLLVNKDSILQCRLFLTGFPRLLESPGFFLKIPGPGKSWKNILENCAFLLVLVKNKQK